MTTLRALIAYGELEGAESAKSQRKEAVQRMEGQDRF